MRRITDKGNDAVSGHVLHPRRRIETIAVNAGEGIDYLPELLARSIWEQSEKRKELPLSWLHKVANCQV